MRSASPPATESAAAEPASVPNPDITARAAIRQAALELFAEHGVASVSVRDIAKRAGVSPALLFHHYGTKDGLREAVDEWITQNTAVAVAQAEQDLPDDIEDLFTARFRVFAAIAHTRPKECAYIARSISEGDEAAQKLFDGMIAKTIEELGALQRRGLIAPDEDETARALLLLFLQLGPLLLQSLVEQHVGTPVFGQESVDRWVRSCARLLTSGLAAEQ
ncbi:MAG: TetR/AcrR family transcriptional regulator [Actinobacteria bacterium]|nr:TetR/AcrR family transcriptional regulator [Actinomycetota bacterium]